MVKPRLHVRQLQCDDGQEQQWSPGLRRLPVKDGVRYIIDKSNHIAICFKATTNEFKRRKIDIKAIKNNKLVVVNLFCMPFLH